MRIFAISDLHIDYSVNKKWVEAISEYDYRDDVLLLAGDISDSMALLGWCLLRLSKLFHKVVFVPGNHDLWVVRDAKHLSSFDKFNLIQQVAADCGVTMNRWNTPSVSIIPLLGWYDYSFGEPGKELLSAWMDFHTCRWPDNLTLGGVTDWFLAKNKLELEDSDAIRISVSHFLPRADLVPTSLSYPREVLNPILGTTRLEQQVRLIKPKIHVYGHSHANQRITLDGITYINNAFGSPRENLAVEKQFLLVHEC